MALPLTRLAVPLILWAAAIGPLAAADVNPSGAVELPTYASVVPNRTFQFPADHGAHPEFRTEWWYITGWLDTENGQSLGFQVTFFRTRPSVDQRNPSAFAAKEILFAHAALSDPSLGRLLHDERAARAGFGLAQASSADTDVVLDAWTLKRDAQGRFHTKVDSKEFALDLAFAPTQAVMLQGENGYSRKGPVATEASYYYSMPHLAVSGSVERAGASVPVKGTAWLDREWSSTYLDENAVGWDWVGLNLDDGAALMAFQIRDAKGGAFWAGGSLRRANGELTRFNPADVRFTSGRRWRSPRTGTEYPVERTLILRLPTGERQWVLKPLFDDQELDGRAGGGPVYWEGAVKAEGARGYLELTGYFQPLRL
jgi:predicted secreted hydrolase